MEIISESHKVESKEMLPQVLLRIFSICKNDPNFPLKDQLKEIEGEVHSLQKTLQRQISLYEKSSNLRKDLQKRVDVIDQNNYDMKSRLLDEMGSV
ncbi:MAG: hypothetical protein K9L62_10850 [Vallitaleaceae bacterium]|nr:hypothetical protein [Vallitaleaceae bacterium]